LPAPYTLCRGLLDPIVVGTLVAAGSVHTLRGLLDPIVVGTLVVGGCDAYCCHICYIRAYVCVYMLIFVYLYIVFWVSSLPFSFILVSSFL